MADGKPTLYTQGMQIRLIWSVGGVPRAINVLNCVNQSAQAASAALANAVQTTVKAGFTSSQLSAKLSSQVTLAAVGVRDVSIANQPEYLSSGAAAPGLDATESLPGMVALCVTTRTALAGRSFRGRVYLFGFTEGMSSGGSIATDAVNAGVAFIEYLRVNLPTSNNLTLGVGSLFENKVERPIGIITPVTNVLSRNAYWETQRRRTAPGAGGQLYWGQQLKRELDAQRVLQQA